MTDAKEMMLLNPDNIVPVIDGMHLITKETFDRFITVITTWYRKEGVLEDNLPNIFPIFNMSDPMVDDFFNVFIESIGWKHLNECMSINFERNREDREECVQIFRSNFDAVMTFMIHDLELALESMNLTYRWDSTYVGGKDYFVKEGVVLEVW